MNKYLYRRATRNIIKRWLLKDFILFLLLILIGCLIYAGEKMAEKVVVTTNFPSEIKVGEANTIEVNITNNGKMPIMLLKMSIPNQYVYEWAREQYGEIKFNETTDKYYLDLRNPKHISDIKPQFGILFPGETAAESAGFTAQAGMKKIILRVDYQPVSYEELEKYFYFADMQQKGDSEYGRLKKAELAVHKFGEESAGRLMHLNPFIIDSGVKFKSQAKFVEKSHNIEIK